MGSMILGGFDVLGDDDDDMDGDDDEVLVGRAARKRLARRARGSKIAVPTPRWMNATTSQGVSRPQEELDFMPFASVSIAAGGLTGQLLANPQRPMRPERLIMDAVSNALSAVSNVVIDPAIYIGAVQVGATQGSTPIAAFGATAFGVRLSMPAAGQGTDCKIFVRLLAAAANATLVSAVMFGRAMR